MENIREKEPAGLGSAPLGGSGGNMHFFIPRVGQDTALANGIGYSASGLNTGGSTMRILIACAIIVSSLVGLTACAHHEKAVVSEPLKLG
jgi:hypothetical protein